MVELKEFFTYVSIKSRLFGSNEGFFWLVFSKVIEFCLSMIKLFFEPLEWSWSVFDIVDDLVWGEIWKANALFLTENACFGI